MIENRIPANSADGNMELAQKIKIYPTSKECYLCKKIHDMPLWKRIMECDCGNKIDRDRNSSINIMIDFLTQQCSRVSDRISQYGLWTAYNNELAAMCCFVDNLRKTGLLIPLWVRKDW